MEDVNFRDMLIELNQSKIATKKWCHLKLIFHCVDIANVDAFFTIQTVNLMRLKDKDLERDPG